MASHTLCLWHKHTLLFVALYLLYECIDVHVCINTRLDACSAAVLTCVYQSYAYAVRTHLAGSS